MSFKSRSLITFYFCGCILIIACSFFAIQINDITLNSRWLNCCRQSEASQANTFLSRGTWRYPKSSPRFQEETEDCWNLYFCFCAVLVKGPTLLDYTNNVSNCQVLLRILLSLCGLYLFLNMLPTSVVYGLYTLQGNA